MNRRDFLQLLGLGAAAVAAPAIVVPERRIWQVSRNAPVGSRIERVYVGVDPGLVDRSVQLMGVYQPPRGNEATSGFVGLVEHGGGWRVRESPGELDPLRSYYKTRGLLGESIIELEGDRVVSWTQGDAKFVQSLESARPRFVRGERA